MSDWPSSMTLRPISTWPGEKTKYRREADFKVRADSQSYRRVPTPLSSTLNTLQTELDQLRAKNVVLEIAIREQDFRIDGRPRATAKAEHPGVILSFDSKHGPLRYPCDTFTRWQDNLRGIALALEALRKVERYGVTKRAEQYRGWQQIEGTGSTERPMDKVIALGILNDLVDDPCPTASPMLLRRAKAAAHPDRHNGDRTLWNNVEQAARVLGIAS